MTYRFGWLPAMAAGLALNTCAGAAIFWGTDARVSAQQAFPDVKPDYWASPFIQSLAERGIIVGYLDGTFRPDQPVDRDEFAALIRKAFEREKVREIPSGSVFNDVPDNYWAAAPIEEAYETGFMNACTGNLFCPQKPIPRVEALASLTKGLNMSYQPYPSIADRAPATPVTASRANRRRVPKYRIAFPVAMTSMIPPGLVAQRASKKRASRDSQPVATVQNVPAQVSALNFLQSHYADADQIPRDAIEPVAAATQAKIVVNYPVVEYINPDQYLKRGTAAAMVYQALVKQGRLKPLPDSMAASRYVVAGSSQNSAPRASK
ncbi:S-layer homology domain-containing protein [Kamptonema formosum]|uniref:S-layer homology domain-containing protein n=1 Tax=Kamptonema formosum TaxID=331992 RepID=UPI000346EADB|nr:S-layer homology domain-containing protein [Oscillatoria sp. PCC 10802]